MKNGKKKKKYEPWDCDATLLEAAIVMWYLKKDLNIPLDIVNFHLQSTEQPNDPFGCLLLLKTPSETPNGVS